uniref:EF-hand domain-containing protein n=1 Tax=Alexandrium monilatum TaxID=311494 RepID=A0A7S4UVP2_9DINO
MSEFAARFGSGPEAAGAAGAAGPSRQGPPPSEEPWVCEVFDSVRSCLSPARSGFSVEEVFDRLDKLQSADGGLSPAEFDKMILTYRPELSVQQLKKLFALVNTSGSGHISLREFKRRFGETVDQPRREPGATTPSLPAAEEGRQGEAWAHKVLEKVRNCLSPERSGHSIEEVFRRLDRLDKADNTLSPKEFFKMILTYEQGLSSQQLQRLFALVNASGSGKITYSEFKKRFG